MSGALFAFEDSFPPASEAAAEIAALMLTPGWGALQHFHLEEKLATWRQILAHHTSQCCRPEHKGGVVASLKLAGLDDVIEISLCHYIVVLELPALFEGDMLASDALGLFMCSMYAICCNTIMVQIMVPYVIILTLSTRPCSTRVWRI
jgi:hypothetical protein